MAFTGTKPAFSSLTIRGIAISLVPLAFKLAGHDLGADGAGLVSHLFDGGLELFGAAIAIYGRIRATKSIA